MGRTPAGRVCRCGHPYRLHRGDECRVTGGCDCSGFVAHPLVYTIPVSGVIKGKTRRPTGHSPYRDDQQQ